MLSRTSRPASRLLLQQRPLFPSRFQPQPRFRRPQPSAAARARFQSTTSVPNPNNKPSSSSGSSSTNTALIGGLAGATSAFLVVYLWYHFSGAKQLVRASNRTQAYLASAKQKVAASTPDVEPNEMLDWLRSTTLAYASLVPGAKAYVNTAFDDLDRVREKHGEQVDEAVREAYQELREVIATDGMSFESVQKTWEVLGKFADRIGGVAGDAAEDILENHPQIKEKIGGNVEQLKQMGDMYGPQVKKEVDEVWEQARGIVKSATGPEAIEKVRQLVQDRIEKIRGMMDEAWKKGMEQAKPYLDRNPKVKQLVEENQDALKQGDFGQLWDMVKQAAESGSTEDIEKFVRGKAQKAKESGMGGLDQLLKTIPGADQITPSIQMLHNIAEKRGKEAERVLKETMEEIQEVLKRRTEQAKKVAEEAEKDTK